VRWRLEPANALLVNLKFLTQVSGLKTSPTPHFDG
jgi:hypothetical protein